MHQAACTKKRAYMKNHRFFATAFLNFASLDVVAESAEQKKLIALRLNTRETCAIIQSDHDILVGAPELLFQPLSG